MKTTITIALATFSIGFILAWVLAPQNKEYVTISLVSEKEDCEARGGSFYINDTSWLLSGGGIEVSCVKPPETIFEYEI